jgi:hypothetical protein
MTHTVDINDELAAVAQPLLETVSQELRIYSRSLMEPYFTSTEFIDQIKRISTSGARAKVRVLVRDHHSMVKNDHPFIKWAQRFTSYISWRTLPGHFQAGAEAMIIGDRTWCILIPTSRSEILVDETRAKTQELFTQFERLFERGERPADGNWLSL